MRKSFCEWNDSNPVHARWCWCSSNARTEGECIGRTSTSAQVHLHLNHFSSNKTYACIDLIHTRQKNKIICSCLWKIINKMTFKMPINMKNINTLPSEKNGSVDVTITHQKHLAQSGRSTRSALDIFNALRVFIKNQSEYKKLSWSVWI